MRPFDLEVWYGERVAVLGLERLRASRTSCGCSPPAGRTPTRSTSRSATSSRRRWRIPASRGSARGCGPGWFAQTHEHPGLLGRTLLEVLHRGDEHRPGKPREEAARALDRYELARASEQTFESLSGGQQARFQILLLELSGATLLLLDEPTDNLDLALGRGAGGGPRRLRRDRGRGHPRPLVRPGVRPLPGVRRGRAGLRVDRAGLGRGPGRPSPLTGWRLVCSSPPC